MNEIDQLDDDFTKTSDNLEIHARINTHITEANDSIKPINLARAILLITGLAGILLALIDPLLSLSYVIIAATVNLPFFIGFYFFDWKPKEILITCISYFILLTVWHFIQANGLPTIVLVFRAFLVLLLFRGKANLEIIDDHYHKIRALGVPASRLKNWKIRERVPRLRPASTT